MWSLTVFLVILSQCRADYECLCSYNVEKPVLASPSQQSTTIGYLYEFDCKPVSVVDGVNNNTWGTITFEKQQGYVEKDQSITIQICPGEPSALDMLTTRGLQTTSTRTSTIPSTRLSTTQMTTTRGAAITTSSTTVTSTQQKSYVTSESTVPTTFSSTTLPSSSIKTTITRTPSTVIIKTTVTKPTQRTTQTATRQPTSASMKSAIPTMTSQSTKLTASTMQSAKVTTNTINSAKPTSSTTQSAKATPTTSQSTRMTASTTYPDKPTTNTTQSATPTTTTLQPTRLTTNATQSAKVATDTTESAKPTTTRLTTITRSTSMTTNTTQSSAQATATTHATKQTVTILPTTISKSPTTTARQTVPSTMASTIFGNTLLCPTSVQQYAQEDGEIIAQNGNSCYAVVPYKVSWSHGENVCNHRGGHLVHVSSSNDNDYIYNLLNTQFNHAVWIGFNDRAQEEHFEWTSGSPVNYTNWTPGRNNNFYSHQREDCTVFVPYLNHGEWDDIPCGSSDGTLEAHYFICQFGISTTKPVQSLPGNPDLCPSRVKYATMRDSGILTHYDKSCYEWVPQRLSWYSAEYACKNNGGHLVQIGDAQEEEFIKKFMAAHDSRHAVWIGLHDTANEESFTWTSGDPLIYTNWIPGRKSNFVSHDTEDCVAFIPYHQGQWDDIPCGTIGDKGEIHPYMCEYKLQSGTNVGFPVIGK